MKWVLVAIGLLPNQPFVSVSDYATLQECFFTGERISTEYIRVYRGLYPHPNDLPEPEDLVNVSCMPSTGTHNPTCGMDDLPPCQ